MNTSSLRVIFRLVVLVALAGSIPLPAQTNAPVATSLDPQASVEPTEPPVPDGVTVEHDIVMGKGGDQDLHAEIAYPKGATKPLHAVIYIHGGGWSKGSQKQSPILALAKAGFFAASIEYRLDDTAKWPAQIQDCKLGVRWLRANASKFNIDPNRIGVWGASAGGHLVACLATMSDVKEYEGTGGYPDVSSAVQVVVDFFGPTDFITPENYTPEALRLTTGLFGKPRNENPELWKSGSPIFYVTAGDPPIFIVHGDGDNLVPLAQSTTFADALTKAGVPNEILVVKNAGHSFVSNTGEKIEPSRGAINKAVFAFFDKYFNAP